MQNVRGYHYWTKNIISYNNFGFFIIKSYNSIFLDTWWSIFFNDIYPRTHFKDILNYRTFILNTTPWYMTYFRKAFINLKHSLKRSMWIVMSGLHHLKCTFKIWNLVLLRIYFNEKHMFCLKQIKCFRTNFHLNNVSVPKTFQIIMTDHVS